MSDEKKIYFDNNATTMMPGVVVDEMVRWVNQGNPSADYASAKYSRKMMSSLRRTLAKVANVTPCCEDVREQEEEQGNATYVPTYKIIFTSGGSECNATIVTTIVMSHNMPNIVLSTIEHKSILSAASAAKDRGLCTLTMVPPRIDGHVYAIDIEKAMRNDTRLVCVMQANNETGAINDIQAIYNVVHKWPNVMLYSDTVQTFCKVPTNYSSCADAFSVAFHKIYGPPGVGALFIKMDYVKGWNLQPLIHGSQNSGLRGGTENVIGLGASLVALRFCNEDRREKNRDLLRLKHTLLSELGMRFSVVSYYDYYLRETKPKSGIEIVVITAGESLPGTLMLSVVKYDAPKICNKKIKTALEERGIIVSVGSACNTSSPSASHVMYALGADDLIRAGALRISLGDHNNVAEVYRFIAEFSRLLTPKKIVDMY